MKLLFDENLSRRLVAKVASAFPGSLHVSVLGLAKQSDQSIWDFARSEGLTIVSKDNDFRQLSFLFGPPPRVIYLSVGNAPTDAVAEILVRNRERISVFTESPDEGLLVLEGSEPS